MGRGSLEYVISRIGADMREKWLARASRSQFHNMNLILDVSSQNHYIQLIQPRNSMSLISTARRSLLPFNETPYRAAGRHWCSMYNLREEEDIVYG